eukprot:7814841-Alexandrium_andersonii.AAC.1
MGDGQDAAAEVRVEGSGASGGADDAAGAPAPGGSQLSQAPGSLAAPATRGNGERQQSARLVPARLAGQYAQALKDGATPLLAASMVPPWAGLAFRFASVRRSACGRGRACACLLPILAQEGDDSTRCGAGEEADCSRQLNIRRGARLHFHPAQSCGGHCKGG